MCIQDDESTCMLAKTTFVSPVGSVPMGEALTIYHAMKWLSCLSLDNVDFVSNSKVTTYDFHQGRVDVTKFSQIIMVAEDCLPFISQTLRSRLVDDKQMR